MGGALFAGATGAAALAGAQPAGDSAPMSVLGPVPAFPPPPPPPPPFWGPPPPPPPPPPFWRPPPPPPIWLPPPPPPPPFWGPPPPPRPPGHWR
ncbi:hypothetical protein NLB33_15400 [Mycolicibacterium smegmatis]|uniref:Uncharacterized protein n=1 Tax=Mycolicibacterium smegmatis (strain ATCC 700084 / mc(2)155) TaxID=246196 RepID=A0R4Q4_MYCS2|nr:hypothetical protein MSMEG_5916 [Mycolicibacterium smegmatis MC2 155]AIU17542.1 hypothetical protein LI99_29260 [Mycolicibacterium smegmatis]AIU10918.1 hypothetical protein LJ00_29255 [Mycolicibacterium smegmatis MC2 155]AIU24166.1 hypothetical protein LI98_29265 [Mycolicibacterium smegmatis]MCP2624241.1 hypothetical protein [Mycolicibacterium smegmatis]